MWAARGCWHTFLQLPSGRDQSTCFYTLFSVSNWTYPLGSSYPFRGNRTKREGDVYLECDSLTEKNALPFLWLQSKKHKWWDANRSSRIVTFDKDGENQPNICVIIHYQHWIQTAPIIECHHLLIFYPTAQGTYHVSWFGEKDFVGYIRKKNELWFQRQEQNANHMSGKPSLRAWNLSVMGSRKP